MVGQSSVSPTQSAVCQPGHEAILPAEDSGVWESQPSHLETLQRQLLVEVKSDQSSFLQFSCSLLFVVTTKNFGPTARAPSVVVPAQADWKGGWAG